jgi:formiminotetrahydrofolate cyclodeaminase
MESSYLTLPVGDFLDALAGRNPAPAGGSAAALTVAQAAALTAKTARLSHRQLTADRVSQLLADSEQIGRAAASLIELDGQAYMRVIEATRAARAEAAGSTDPAEALALALSRAADVPLRLVELAVKVAMLAAELAHEGNPALRGDAVTAEHLARAGGQAAATLVRINLASAPDDPRLTRIDQLLAQLAAAC